jgi:hypothetical protein
MATPSLLLIPDRYKSGVLYSQLPESGAGDLTFTRASAATRVNASGLIESVASGVPRLDYTGGGCPSLLLEPQRTNTTQFSEQMDNAYWEKFDMTIAANNAASPDGFINADKLEETATTNLHYAGAGAGQMTATNTYTASAFFKASERSFAWIYIYNGVEASGLNAFFNLSNGTIGTIDSGITATITNYGNGWYRCTVTRTITGNADAGWGFGTTTTDGVYSYLGTAGSGIFAWGAQLEEGSYPTSYIPTTSAAVTRAADTYQKANFGNTSTAGTLYYEFDNFQPSNPANGLYMIQLFAGSSVGDADFADSNGISIINNIAIEGRNNGYATTLFSFTPAAGANVKIALRYDGTNVVAFLNGVKGTVFADDSVGVKNAIRVNNGENGSQSTRALAFYPVALTDAECIALTTL